MLIYVIILKLFDHLIILQMDAYMPTLHILYIRNSNFSGTEQFIPGTQAFASPPDMASSGVWENIILYKTPTFDGVYGMLYYII